MSALLRVENLTKRFPGVVANDHLSLEIMPGEVHALLGENGAGKSTLMNILYGLVQPDEGRIIWKNDAVRIGSPHHAIALGIGMVHQHFIQVGSLTVLQNVVLGMVSGLSADWKAAERRLLELASVLGQPIQPHARVDSLSVGERQRVEIFKAIYRDAELLILDEPTASLTPDEAEQLFSVCRTLKGQGKSIVFITHKLDEVRALSDRITVLRRGRSIATIETAASTDRDLARLMVGQDLPQATEKRAFRPGQVVLEVRNLRVPGEQSKAAVDDVSFTIRRGEILGIAGVDGNGQTELVEAILGLRRASQGFIFFHQSDVTDLAPSERLQQGLAIIPADRHAQAVIQDFSLQENALLGFSQSPIVAKFGFLRRDAVQRFTQRIITDFQVKAPSSEVALKTLSGGHQQRFVFGRTLQHRLDLLIAVQPARGLDLISATFVRTKLLELRDAGKAVLLVSMDLDEILLLSDRIGVIHEGRVVGSATPSLSREEIGLMMAGIEPFSPLDAGSDGPR